jgi:hypothetical protein
MGMAAKRKASVAKLKTGAAKTGKSWRRLGIRHQ